MSSLPQASVCPSWGAGQTGLGSCNSKKVALAPSRSQHPPTTTTTHILGSPPLTCDGWFFILGTFEVFFYQLGCDTDHMLALPVLDHVEGLQGADDVILGDAGHLAAERDKRRC